MKSFTGARTGNRRWIGHLGVGAFLFFLVKGLLWLVVPLVLVLR